MAASSNSSEDTISDINIVPLVDIILVVLIIFMVTAPVAVTPLMELNLPESSSSENSEQSSLQFQVTLDGRILKDGAEVSESEVRSIAIEEFQKNSKVQAVIAADQDTNYGQVIQLLDWLKSSGLQDLAVTTAPH